MNRIKPRLPLIMLSAFIVVFAAIVLIFNGKASRARHDQFVYSAETLGKSIGMRLKGNEDYLVMLAKDRAAGSLDQGLFQKRASSYVREHPELVNITWVDAGFHIRDVAPLASNSQILGLHLDLPEPMRVSQQAKEKGRPVYTRPFEAIQGEPSFEVWVPVYDGNRFLGLFGGVYSCRKILSTLVPPRISAASYAALVAGTGHLLSELPKSGDLDDRMVYKVAITPGESGVWLQLASYSRRQDWVLLGLEALCLSLVVGMAYAVWTSRREIAVRRRLEEELHAQALQLENELAEREAAQENLQEQTIALEEEVEERRRAEEALRQSETTVRNKLSAILEPDGDIGTLELSDIVDCEMLQSMLEDFYKLTGLLGAVLDTSGKVLVAVGWQDICTCFHRCHPETLKNCLESDTILTTDVPVGTFKHYRCKNNMWDMVTPLEVGGKHVGNIFIGQFFFEDETPDVETFREQARRYGFDEDAYLAALDRVPRFSRERANAGMQFYAKFTKMISTLSFSSIKLSRTLTERIQLEEQLRQSQKMEAVGQLAGGVAHDFNNILQVISGFAHILKRGATLTERQNDAIGHILSASEKAAQLTKGLLTFSRKQVIEPRPVDLDEVVENVKRFLVRVIGEDIELRTVSRSHEVRVNADVGQLEQVLVNLATNARDAMPKGGVLTIETGLQTVEAAAGPEFEHAQPGRYALMTVSDSGNGMDEETRRRLFEPFYTTKEVGKGTGLGMSIVYGIIKQHNGFINVDSAQGEGTTFRIYLPICGEEPAAESTAVQVPLPQPGSETILLAEDDPHVRAFEVTVLTDFGYTVIEAVDGEDAVEKFSRNRDRIAMIVMDIIMPRKSGREAYDEICRIQPNVKVLYSSGYTADFIEERGVSEHEVDLMMKPVQPMELLRRVRKVLDS